MIISLYAGGMTVRDIRHHLASTIGVDLSAGTISKITDAVRPEPSSGRRRPLEAFYPVIYLDAIRVHGPAPTTRSPATPPTSPSEQPWTGC